MGSSPSLGIYDHTSNPHHSLLPALRAHLPYSMPLLRRIQFEITGEVLASRSSTARFLATFPVDADVQTLQQEQNQQQTEFKSESESAQGKLPWLAAFVDLYTGMETQGWVYSSLEASASTSAPRPGPSLPQESVTGAASKASVPINTFSNLPQPAQDTARTQLLSLLQYVKLYLQPEYIASLNSSSIITSSSNLKTIAKEGPSVPSHVIPPAPPETILLGSLHTGLLALLKESGEYNDPETVTSTASGGQRVKVKIHRYDKVPYVKYLFAPRCWRSTSTRQGHPQQQDGENEASVIELPSGYRFTDRRGHRKGLQEYQVPLVISRTHIPRSKQTLVERMKSVVVYHAPSDNPATATAPGSGASGTGHSADAEVDGREMPVAWCFMGLDASLATLHVEPEHRGKGIAVLLSRETMRWGMDDERGGRRFRARGFGKEGKEDEGEHDSDLWVHADVAFENTASRKVMEKLGGQLAWTVTWTVVELLDS